MATIDLDKLDNCFNSLHESEAGRKALAAFREALDPLRDAMPENPNDAEFLYILRSIVNDMTVENYAASRTTASGELSDESLEQVAGGAGLTSIRVQRFGTQSVFPDLGFTLRGVI